MSHPVSLPDDTAAPTALSEYEWLVSDRAEPFLTSIAAEPDPLAAARRLRGELSVERVHLVLEEVRLRARARRKFTLADRLFFTPIGLEQATDEWIASYKAARFDPGERVVDLCSGIGGDLMALARRGPALGVDRDPVAAPAWPKPIVCDRCGAPSGRNRRGQAMRSPSKRATRPGNHSNHRWRGISIRTAARRAGGRHKPNFTIRQPLRSTCCAARSADGAVKLAPAAELPEAWSREGELEWISFARECRQLVVWFGRLAIAAGSRRATIVDRQTVSERSVIGRAESETPSAARIGRYVFEPDSAVLAADLVGALAQELTLAAITPGAVYLTGDRPIRDPAVATFEVLDVVPFDVKRLKKILRAGGFGRLEVKKRGTGHDPAAVARQLKVPGEHSATLLIARLGKPVVAILARRMDRGGS